MPNPYSCEKNIYQLKHNVCILILSLTFQNTVKILFSKDAQVIQFLSPFLMYYSRKTQRRVTLSSYDSIPTSSFSLLLFPLTPQTSLVSGFILLRVEQMSRHMNIFLTIFFIGRTAYYSYSLSCVTMYPGNHSIHFIKIVLIPFYSSTVFHCVDPPQFIQPLSYPGTFRLFPTCY